MVLVAVTAVASFQSVGNILVVAMFVVPPAAAYMLTDRLAPMIVISVLGHFGCRSRALRALSSRAWFGYRSTTTAGMMAVAAGVIFVIVACCSPRHGILIKIARRRILAWQILADYVVAPGTASRRTQRATVPSRNTLQNVLLADNLSLGLVLRWLGRRGDIVGGVEEYRLTEQGTMRARGLVRSHRLWEQYLVSQAGVAAERTHDQAEQLEHYTDQRLRQQLDEETHTPQRDPHGSVIPAEPSEGTTGPGQV